MRPPQPPTVTKSLFANYLRLLESMPFLSSGFVYIWPSQRLHRVFGAISGQDATDFEPGSQKNCTFPKTSSIGWEAKTLGAKRRISSSEIATVPGMLLVRCSDPSSGQRRCSGFEWPLQGKVRGVLPGMLVLEVEATGLLLKSSLRARISFTAHSDISCHIGAQTRSVCVHSIAWSNVKQM